jgi:hypothetical protein
MARAIGLNFQLWDPVLKDASLVAWPCGFHCLPAYRLPLTSFPIAVTLHERERVFEDDLIPHDRAEGAGVFGSFQLWFSILRNDSLVAVSADFIRTLSSHVFRTASLALVVCPEWHLLSAKRLM